MEFIIPILSHFGENTIPERKTIDTLSPPFYFTLPSGSDRAHVYVINNRKIDVEQWTEQDTWDGSKSDKINSTYEVSYSKIFPLKPNMGIGWLGG